MSFAIGTYDIDNMELWAYMTTEPSVSNALKHATQRVPKTGPLTNPLLFDSLEEAHEFVESTKRFDAFRWLVPTLFSSEDNTTYMGDSSMLFGMFGCELDDELCIVSVYNLLTLDDVIVSSIKSGTVGD